MNTKTKQILLTFDFELFLGSRSGTVDNCLIKPTKELMKVLVQHDLSAIFFVDTLYLHRLKNESLQNQNAKFDYEKIITLLRELIDKGSYIFHHIHPHWLDANYLEEFNEWDVSNKERFALVNLKEEEIECVFGFSDEIIKEIYSGKKTPLYMGYRAGGLYAQPFDRYRKQMKKYNIKIDFSVLKNAKSTGGNGLYSFDYSNFPAENIYFFSSDLLIKDGNGEFVEIMLDQFCLKGIHKIINGLHYRKNSKKMTWQKWGDGKSSGNILKSVKRTNKFKSEETFSIELLNEYKVHLYLNYLKREELLHIISHPKLFSPANISAFESLIHQMKRKFQIESNLFSILDHVGLKANNE